MAETPISKELLSAVLNCTIFRVEPTTTALARDELYFISNRKRESAEGDKIDLDKLARKCKLWALDEGYLIDERGKDIYILTTDGIDVIWHSYGEPFNPLRVFEASEWVCQVLSMKENKAV